jgi:hypothetical protein
MAIRRNVPPWDYLHQASTTSLESYELSRLNHAANMRGEIGALIEQWVEDMAHALLAQWVREDRVIVPPVMQPQFTKQAHLSFREPLSSREPVPEEDGLSQIESVKFTSRSRTIVR